MRMWLLPVRKIYSQEIHPYIHDFLNIYHCYLEHNAFITRPLEHNVDIYIRGGAIIGARGVMHPPLFQILVFLLY